MQLYQQHGSVIAAQRAFRRLFGVRSAPSKDTILRLHRQFEKEGSVHPKGHTRKPRARTAENVQKVKQALKGKEKTSTRQIEMETGIARQTVHRILRQDLQLFPYKMQFKQKLHRGDKAARLSFCTEFGKRASPRFIDNLLMSDEARFDTNGNVNKQNWRYWSESNPHLAQEKQTYPDAVTVWAAVSAQGVIGPYFFEGTVNSKSYCRMVKGFLLKRLSSTGLPINKLWFQQDGAKPHTAKASIAQLKQIFGNRIISQNATFPWPARSPDLTAADFFLWGHVKDQVYRKPVKTIAELKRRIRDSFRAIPRAMARSALQAVPGRCKECLRRRGGHLDNIIFRP